MYNGIVDINKLAQHISADTGIPPRDLIASIREYFTGE